MVKITSALIIVNVLVFILVFSLPEGWFNKAFDILSFSSSSPMEIWRWISAMFMHTSASHLFFNMLGLYFFGRVLEDEVKPEWFLSIYFVSGVIGNLAFMLTSSLSAVGASGAVFGLIGAAMLLKPSKSINLYIFPIPLGIVAIIYVIIETLMVYFRSPDASGVAHIAHLAGVLTGAVYAFFYSTKKAAKGLAVLGICVVLLVFLAPVFGIAAVIGSIALEIIDMVIGFFLYGIAGIINLLVFGGA